jgi:hemerythrin-like domain-containing protein
MRRQGSVSRVIAAEATRLYQWIADVTRTPEWSPETWRCQWTDPARQAHSGDRFYGLNRSGPLRWTRVCEVVVAEPGREFSFRTVPEGKVSDSTVWTFRFEPVEGGTRVTHAYEIVEEMPRRQQQLAAFLTPKHRDRQPDMARSLERIADAIEGRADVRQAELGQAHTAQGPLNLSGIYAMHHGFRRDLHAMAHAVPATPPADAETWGALARRWTGFAAALHHHHTIEDEQIWPRVLERATAAADTEACQTLEAMEAEHELIDPLIETCGEGFQAMAGAPQATTRDRLAADVSRFRELLNGHLAHEETDALPLVQRYLSAATWRDSEAAARKEFGIADLGFTVPWTTLEMPLDQRRLVFADSGLIIRIILALTRHRFAREHRTAFRWL